MSRLKIYSELAKIRLTTTVLFSSIVGYILGTNTTHGDSFDWVTFMLLSIGGFLVIASANGFNQVYERETDKLMKRTEGRPLPQGKISPTEGIIFSTIAGIIGILALVAINLTCAIYGGISLVLYAAIYTPLKRVSPIAVLVGAFPGAIPAMIGWLAATNTFGIEPGVLFAIQFLWQFPHFWAIAWLQDDEYKKAGIRLLPSGMRDERSAYQMMTYSLWLIPVSILPAILPVMGVEHDLNLSWVGAGLIALLGVWVFMDAYKLMKECTMEAAKKLMFTCLKYLPLVQIIYVVDKYI
ncbi:MAG: heme o synthase [Flavobacteriales bacterium]|nr:heme o synthase [Flavobacteriales bacterium]